MQTVTVFKAEDNATFDTLEKCQDYEAMIAVIKKYEQKYFKPHGTDILLLYRCYGKDFNHTEFYHPTAI